MKIFEFNQGQSGTLIDSVSKTAGTFEKDVGSFKRTEKGNAFEFSGTSATSIYFSNNSLHYTSEDFWFSANVFLKSGTLAPRIISIPNSYDIGIYQDKIIFNTRQGATTQTTSSDAIFTYNKWYNIIVQRQGSSVKIFINNVDETKEIDVHINPELNANPFFIGAFDLAQSSYQFKGFIQNIKSGTGILTAQERNTLYEQFLQASPTEKPIRDFEYPKPTDLSYEDGLVAAYSFSPETVSNGTLIDVSGNGNNGIIYGALITKDGLSFNNKGYVDLGSSNAVNIGKTFSVSWRGTVNNPLNDMVIYGGNYIRVSSPTTLTTFFGSSADNLIIPALKNNEEYTFTVTRNEQEVKWYINGSYAGGYTSTANDDLIYKLIGCVNLSTQLYSGVINDLRIMSYAFTSDQAKAYHNSFVHPTLILDFSDEAVGNTI